MNTAFPESPREAFAAALLDWYGAVKRPFPWRESADPYRVWVSEIMLQQTQADRGVAYFNAWMRRFPDIRSVAEAGEEEVLAAWEGLGYYSRARNLRKAAKRILDDHGGVFPKTREAVLALPGVGGYTAGAILSIAFGRPEPAVDANVLRVFARILDVDRPVSDSAVKSRVTEAVGALMPDRSPGDFTQALMELGALVCGKVPRCGECPVRPFCEAHRNGTAAKRPVKTAKAAYVLREMVAGIVEVQGKVFIRKRPPGGLWAGMWEFPGGEVGAGSDLRESAVGLVAEAIGVPVSIRDAIATVRHGYTTNRVTLHGYFCEIMGEVPAPPGDAEKGAWIARKELARLAFPAGHRKLLERLGWK